MKWILRFKYFTANIVKLIHIVIYPKPKKEPKYSLAVWELRYINSCRLTMVAHGCLKIGILEARTSICILEQTECKYFNRARRYSNVNNIYNRRKCKSM